MRRPAPRSGGAPCSAGVEEEAGRREYRRVEMWSDTRVTDAHRLYEKLGYRRLPDIREIHDRSNSTEYHYRKVA